MCAVVRRHALIATVTVKLQAGRTPHVLPALPCLALHVMIF